MHPLPTPFNDTMKAQLGDAWGAFMAAHEAPPPVSIRLNPLKRSAVAADSAVPWSTTGRYLSQRPAFTFDPAFHAGAYYVQEASSMFLEQAFLQIGGSRGGLHVLDLCAAPGGKSTHLLSLMSSDSLLVSNEVIRSRANILSENIQKWGAHNVVVTSSDPQQFSSLDSLFDVVVVDAPCSGEGLFRKDPAAIQSWSPENVVLCTRRQRRILEDVWPVIKTGGHLIYATCTYNENENEKNLAELLSQGDAESVSLQVKEDWNIASVHRLGVHGYRFYPHKTSGEGFFLAVIKKTSGTEARAKGSVELTRVAARVEDTIKHWINFPVRLFTHMDEIHAIPNGSERLLNLLARHVYIVHAGTLVGTIKQNKVIPGHGAALSVYLDQSQWPTLDLDYDTAIRYLRKEAIEPGDLPRGFALVRHNSLPLGWVNVLDTRSNNMYPPDWRIRTQSQAG